MIVLTDSFLTSKCIWHPLDAVFVLGDVHDGYTRDFPDPPLQVSVTSSHNVALVLWGGETNTAPSINLRVPQGTHCL